MSAVRVRHRPPRFALRATCGAAAARSLFVCSKLSWSRRSRSAIKLDRKKPTPSARDKVPTPFKVTNSDVKTLAANHRHDQPTWLIVPVAQWCYAYRRCCSDRFFEFLGGAECDLLAGLD